MIRHDHAVVIQADGVTGSVHNLNDGKHRRRFDLLDGIPDHLHIRTVAAVDLQQRWRRQGRAGHVGFRCERNLCLTKIRVAKRNDNVHAVVVGLATTADTIAAIA